LRRYIRTLRLRHCWADVDDTWHGSGDTSSRKAEFCCGHRSQHYPGRAVSRLKIFKIPYSFGTALARTFILGTQILRSRISEFSEFPRHHPQLNPAAFTHSVYTQYFAAAERRQAIAETLRDIVRQKNPCEELDVRQLPASHQTSGVARVRVWGVKPPPHSHRSRYFSQP